MPSSSLCQSVPIPVVLSLHMETHREHWAIKASERAVFLDSGWQGSGYTLIHCLSLSIFNKNMREDLLWAQNQTQRALSKVNTRSVHLHWVHAALGRYTHAI